MRFGRDFRLPGFINNLVVVKKGMPVLSLGGHGDSGRGIQIRRNGFVKNGGVPMAAELAEAAPDQKLAPGAVEIRGSHFWSRHPAGGDSCRMDLQRSDLGPERTLGESNVTSVID